MAFLDADARNAILLAIDAGHPYDARKLESTLKFRGSEEHVFDA